MKGFEIDPEAASRIHENDIKRIIRAIEVYTPPENDNRTHKDIEAEPPPYTYVVFGLDWDREELYRRIDDRVDKMIRNGLVDEARRLVKMGYDRGTTAMQAIGYKEILPYLKGECSLEEAVDTLKRNTRRYAKRQMTWFRRIREINWLDMNEDTDLRETAGKIIDRCIETYGIIL